MSNKYISVALVAIFADNEQNDRRECASRAC